MRYLLLLTFLLGTTASFASHKHKKDNKVYDYGSNQVVTLTPFSGVVSYGYFNPAVGLDWEYIVSRKLGLGIHVPVMYGFIGPEQSDYNGNSSNQHSSIFTAPGIRFHTGTKDGTVDFSTGPSLLYGNLHFNPTMDYNGQQITDARNVQLFGLLCDNSINFTRQHFIFGFNVKVGTCFQIQESTRFFIQFGMQFGGRF